MTRLDRAGNPLPELDEIAMISSTRELNNVMNRTKHGPDGSGRRGPCDPDCRKCAAQRRMNELAGLPPEPPAPTRTRWLAIAEEMGS